MRAPFKTDDLHKRAVLLQCLGYDGIELGPEFLDRSVESILSDLKGTGIVVSAIVGLTPIARSRSQSESQSGGFRSSAP